MKPPVRLSAHAQPHYDCRSGCIPHLLSAHDGDRRTQTRAKLLREGVQNQGGVASLPCARGQLVRSPGRRTLARRFPARLRLVTPPDRRGEYTRRRVRYFWMFVLPYSSTEMTSRCSPLWMITNAIQTMIHKPSVRIVRIRWRMWFVFSAGMFITAW